MCVLVAGDNNFAQQNPRACFDGWSNFKRLVNNNPPYAMAYSNPKKIKLTEEVSTNCMGY